jgi:hypothetical protein
LLSLLTVGMDAQIVKSDSVVTIETPLFSPDSYYVAPMHFRFSSIFLYGGTTVRIVFNSSEPVNFYIQNSLDFNVSSSSNWTTVLSEWSSKTPLLDRAFVVPVSDRWYFTFVNEESDTNAPPIAIYYVTLYRIDTYDIHMNSDKQSYSLGEQALLTASVKSDGNPAAGLNVSLQVFGLQGPPLSSQNGLTDSYGNVAISFVLPSEEGVFHCVAKTSVAGNPIEDSVTFIASKNPALPYTFDDYDGLWHTSDFTITLMAFDGGSGIEETYYQLNNGPIQYLTTSGQPQITLESVNNTLEYWSRDNAGHEEIPHKFLTGIELDKTPPNGSIIIGENTTYVNSTSAVLTLSASDAISGVNKMHFSNDNRTWTGWKTFTSTANWTLAPGDGPKTVYAQFMDNAGLVSDTYSATMTLDTTSPVIENVSQIPGNEVQASQSTKILANITDAESGVGRVILSYTINGNNTWTSSQMSFNSTTRLYESIIPGQRTSTQVEYKILAYDNCGNEKTGDNQGQYYVYTVVPEFPSFAFTLLLIAMTLLATALWTKTSHSRRRIRFPSK